MEDQAFQLLMNVLEGIKQTQETHSAKMEAQDEKIDSLLAWKLKLSTKLMLITGAVSLCGSIVVGVITQVLANKF